MVTMPGGFWYPDRPNAAPAIFNAIAVAPGQSIGNRFTLPVRTAGCSIAVDLDSPATIQLLTDAGVIVQERAWLPGHRRQPDVLPMWFEWTASVELAAAAYRLVISPTGAGSIVVLSLPATTTPARLGVQITRIAPGAPWVEDPARWVSMSLRIDGL